jgi:hypothetical protein
MSPLELKRMKLELVKVSAARHDIEFRIEERLDEIERLKEHIKVQVAKEAELKDKIDAENAAS